MLCFLVVPLGKGGFSLRVVLVFAKPWLSIKNQPSSSIIVTSVPHRGALNADNAGDGDDADDHDDGW